MTGPFPIGGPYKGDDPAEWTFKIFKIIGGGRAPLGTPIKNGDQISLRINSDWGKKFFFRVAGAEDGAEVSGDGLNLGVMDTLFVVEFSEVRSGLGWRPSVIKCQSCAVVTARVTHAGTGIPISSATVVADVPGHPFGGTTGGGGRAVLVDAAGRDCVPAGNVPLRVSADRHQTKTVSVAVPDAGNIEVNVQLECTQVRGRVIDSAGNAVPGVTVYLRDEGRNVLRDENGNPYKVTTAADGSFAFSCVAHQYASVWTTADPSQEQHKEIPPEGWTNVTIVVQLTCGNLVGTVTDAETGQPVAGATVTESGGRQTITDAEGRFTFNCVKQAGSNTVFASAPGYSEDFAEGLVPAVGNSSSVDIKLHRVGAMEYQIRLDWGTHPSDLDSHLSGPDTLGGRFHLFYGNIGAPPVPFASLDLDDTTMLGPETITIRRSPATAAGAFVVGEYRYWVHNYSATFDPTATFNGSSATASVSAVDFQGNLTAVARYDVSSAGGIEDDIWRVVNLAIDANGNIAVAAIQNFQPGDQNTVL